MQYPILLTHKKDNWHTGCTKKNSGFRVTKLSVKFFYGRFQEIENQN